MSAITPRTYDGVEVVVGLRVFTNDWKWGTVTELGRTEYARDADDVWHTVSYADDARPGDRGPLMNRQRMTTGQRVGAPADPLTSRRAGGAS